VTRSTASVRGLVDRYIEATGRADLLLEIGTEEIPARFIDGALEGLAAAARGTFAEHGLEFGAVRTMGTPRRLALCVTDLRLRQEDRVTEVRGPSRQAAFDAEGRPTRAALGFARAQGVDVADLEVRSTPAGDYVFAVRREAGRPAAQVLAEGLPELVARLEFPRTMRWGRGDFAFVRPIHWVVALLGKDEVRFSVAGVASGRCSRGHRFLHPGPVEIDGPSAYVATMEAARVLVDPAARRERIRSQVEAAARAAGGRAAVDETLLTEVTHLVEWPEAVTGRFDEAFLDLPEAVLVTVMRHHQRYFPVVDEAGRLLPAFVTVANGIAGQAVRLGNEGVLRARLADARFFHDEDLKAPLAERVERLGEVGFVEGLGSMRDKVERVRTLARHLVEAAGHPDAAGLPAASGLPAVVDRAALLCKADLVTQMVRELPELEGVMGREYALKSGEDPAVAQAIFEHTLPRFAGDALPDSPAGTILALADKLDTVAACFAAGIRPTGSQDPYGLRRQALGVVQVLLKAGLPLDLADLVDRALAGFGPAAPNAEGTAPDREPDRASVRRDLLEFFSARLRTVLDEAGISYDVADAVLDRGPGAPVVTLARARALQEFKDRPAFADLKAAYIRVSGLGEKAPHARVAAERFTEPAERALWDAFQQAWAGGARALERGDYGAYLETMAALRPEVDRFFDGVLVMTDDPAVRENRLALLRRVLEAMNAVGHVGKLVGP